MRDGGADHPVGSAPPLDGVRVVELAAIGPVPFGVMILADLGADVVRVDRVAAATGSPGAEAAMVGLSRGRRSVAVDVRTPDGRDVVLALADRADVLVEGMRPGVAERLGIGPEPCLGRNPRLVYARTTGWGQDGPLRDRAGHDIDYAAVAGALHPIGRRDDPPPPPLNLLSDFAGGGTYLAIGVLGALLERGRSGRGQVLDVAMVDGTAHLTAFFHGLLAGGAWTTQRQSNLLDGGMPFYDTYRCADGRFIAVGALEPRFFAALLDGLDLDPATHPQEATPALRQALSERFATRTRDEWAEHFAGTDACVAPVLDLAEAPEHPHLIAREVFVDVGGTRQPAPAPRFSRSALRAGPSAPEPGQHTDAILAELGYDRARVDALRRAGVVA